MKRTEYDQYYKQVLSENETASVSNGLKAMAEGVRHIPPLTNPKANPYVRSDALEGSTLFSNLGLSHTPDPSPTLASHPHPHARTRPYLTFTSLSLSPAFSPLDISLKGWTIEFASKPFEEPIVYLETKEGHWYRLVQPSGSYAPHYAAFERFAFLCILSISSSSFK